MYGMDLSSVGKYLVSGCRRQNSETSCSIKGGKFLSPAERPLSPQEPLCSMDLRKVKNDLKQFMYW
jgi:hypothetical protein